jgi:hypothetical protein
MRRRCVSRVLAEFGVRFEAIEFRKGGGDHVSGKEHLIVQGCNLITRIGSTFLVELFW